MTESKHFISNNFSKNAISNANSNANSNTNFDNNFDNNFDSSFDNNTSDYQNYQDQNNQNYQNTQNLSANQNIQNQNDRNNRMANQQFQSQNDGNKVATSGTKFQIVNRQNSFSNEPFSKEGSDTVIRIFGVGGGGGNAVEHMIESDVYGVEFVVANTDSQALNNCHAPKKIALGDSGLGAGAKPEKGKAAAELQTEEIRAALEGSNMVFITAGMGGGTGTGAAPIVAKIAKEMGILTVGVVTKPFAFEGKRRVKAATTGLEELLQNVDSLIVVVNDNLMELLGEDATLAECFSKADDVLKNAVCGIIEIIYRPGLINVDFEDVRTVMSDMGRSMMGFAEAEGVDRARIAAQEAIASPLLDGVNLATASGILVNVSGSKESLKLKECYEVMNVIKSIANNNDEDYIVWGAVYDDSLGDKIRVTVVATGLEVQMQKIPEIVVTQHSKTGTDDFTASSGGSRVVDTPAVNRRRRGGNIPPNMTAEGLANSGVDHFTIPAFLRKQAD